MLPLLKRQWFLLSLVTVLVVGFSCSEGVRPFAEAKSLRNWIVASVLFVMALPLDARSVMSSIRNPWPALLASAVNMVCLPIGAWFLARLLTGDLRTGLLVAAAVPCTLASAAVWTRRAGGDDTIAVLVTVLTNFTCFLTTPFLLYLSTGSELSAVHQSQLARMPIRLAMLVVLPMGLAQLARRSRPIANWATAQKVALSTYTQIGILSMVLAGAAISATHLADQSWDRLSELAGMAGCAFVLHVAALWGGLRLARWFGFTRPQQIAVGMAGSQKTLMVGLDLAISYFGGLAIMPLVTYHFIQLVVDTLVADRLRSGDS